MSKLIDRPPQDWFQRPGTPWPTPYFPVQPPAQQGAGPAELAQLLALGQPLIGPSPLPQPWPYDLSGSLSAGAGSVSYAVRDGYFLRTGPIVFFEGNVTCASVSGMGGGVSVTGLPYPAAVTTYGITCNVGGFNYNIYTNDGIEIITQVSAGTTNLIIQTVQGDGTVSVFSAGMQNNTIIQFEGFYFTSAAF